MTQQTVNTYVFAYISTKNGVNFMILVLKCLSDILTPKSFKLTEIKGKQKKHNIFPRAEITENSAKANFTK